ncbi:MAG: SIS domain-containing protein [Elusimicrobia bacterium]|nr:SIS domain-containing protein [Elusimicrobiota bacterium]
MKNFVEKYYERIIKLTSLIETIAENRIKIPFNEGICRVAELIKKQTALGKKLIFIGNGASATISSHQATDFWKNGGMRAIAFNDAALITCVSNDIGYEHVFEKSIEMFADDGDVLIAISSSGQSKNIIKGAMSAQRKNCEIITLSGFSARNPLRDMGKINFYVPSNSYGHIEILHHSICHCVLEYIIESAKK